MPKKRSKPGGPYYDKSGRRLPEPMVEHITKVSSISFTSHCRNCKKPIKPNDKYTSRFFGPSGTDKERYQGPLCSNCSELPPENIESRGWW